MHAAAYNENLEVIKILIEADADLNARANNNYIPLHCAAFSGNIEVMKFFKELGVDVYTQDNNGRTPLGLDKTWLFASTITFGRHERSNSKREKDNTLLMDAAANGLTFAVKDLLVIHGLR